MCWVVDDMWWVELFWLKPHLTEFVGSSRSIAAMKATAVATTGDEEVRVLEDPRRSCRDGCHPGEKRGQILCPWLGDDQYEKKTSYKGMQAYDVRQGGGGFSKAGQDGCKGIPSFCNQEVDLNAQCHVHFTR